ncbi:hypothetical protein ACWIGM_08785 [Bosea sp. NPDC055332]
MTMPNWGGQQYDNLASNSALRLSRRTTVVLDACRRVLTDVAWLDLADAGILEVYSAGCGVNESKPTDEQLLTAVGGGSRTAYIARKLGLIRNRAWVLARLKYLQAAGLVVRDERYSAVNDYYWRRP